MKTVMIAMLVVLNASAVMAQMTGHVQKRIIINGAGNSSPLSSIYLNTNSREFAVKCSDARVQLEQNLQLQCHNQYDLRVGGRLAVVGSKEKTYGTSCVKENHIVHDQYGRPRVQYSFVRATGSAYCAKVAY